MVVAFLMVLSLVYSQNFPAENKPEKFNACYYLTKLKLTLDKEIMDTVVRKLGTPEKAGNRISSDILLKCYKAISLETSIKILQQGENLVYDSEYDPLVIVDYDEYRPDGLELTPELLDFFDEIKKVKTQAEEEAEKPIPPQPPLPAVGAWYIVIVVIVFGLFIYWASNKVLNKPQTKARDRKNKKKN